MNQDERERLTRVETELKNVKVCLRGLKKDVKTILTNDLPHITERIAELDKKVAVLAVKVSIGAGIASLLASAIVNWLFR